MSESSLPDKIKWTIPKDYRRSEHAKRVAEYRPVVCRWIAVAVVTALLGTLLIYAFPGNRLWMTIGAGLVLGAIIVLSHGFQHYTVIGLARSISVHPVFTKRGPAGMSWAMVKWYQVTDVPDHPRLRALEMCIDLRFSDLTSLLPFDPAEVDEAQLLAFLEHHAPGKRWQH